MSNSVVAEEWIEEHYLNIPDNTRPSQKDIKRFSNIFSSYLVTSFDLVEDPGKRLYSRAEFKLSG
jgi:hypothetical protein